MRSRPGLRLVLALATLALFGAFGGTASALNLDTSTDTSLTLDNDSNWFHGAWAPYTYGNYQFVAYWDDPGSGGGDVNLVVMRRRLSDNDRDVIVFDGAGTEEQYALEAPMDGHNGVAFGVSPNDGRVHLSWSLHTSDRRHRYVVSAPGCFDQANFTDANCDFRRRRVSGVDAYYQADRSAETELTYPEYFNDRRGRLYMGYRYDASSRGNWILNTYDDAGRWTALGTIVRGTNPSNDPNLYYRYDPDGAGPIGTVTSRMRGVYVDEFKFDKDDRLHVTWIYRENGDGSTHGIYYAYSDDYGQTWRNNDGRSIATARTDPVTIIDQADTVVVNEPPGYRLGSYMLELDSNNQPHLVKPVSENQTTEGMDANLRMAHWWRTVNGDWHAQYVESSGEGWPSKHTGDLLFDGADNAYATWGRNDLGWAPWNSSTYNPRDLPPERVTWQGGEYLDVQLFSAASCLQTTEPVKVAASTSGVDTVRIRLRNNTAGTDVKLFWTTSASRDFDVARGQTFVRGIRANDANYTDYSLRVTDADWAGTLRQLEFCLPDNVSSGSVSIDSIALYNSAARTTAKTWSFRSGWEMYVAEAASTDNWASWSRGEVFPEGLSIIQADSLWRMDNVRYARDRKVNFVLGAQGAPGTETLTLREFRILGDTVIKSWPFDYDQIGWTASDVTGFGWSNDGGTKGIGGTIASADPVIVSMPNLDVPTGSNRYVHVRLKNTSAARRAALFFITNADRTWNTTKRVQFPITANSGYTTYTVDMSAAAGWSGQTLYQLRLDPVDDGTASGSFRVDRIWIDNTP